jgi:hypothetical protein
MPSKKRTVKRTTKKSTTAPKSKSELSITMDSISEFTQKLTLLYMNYAYDAQASYMSLCEETCNLTEIAKKSWIVNLKTILAPTWADADLSNHPFVDTKDDIQSFFYLLTEDAMDETIFKTALQEVTILNDIHEEHFSAILESRFDDQMNQLDSNDSTRFAYFRLKNYMNKILTFFSYKNNRDEEITFREKLYHLGAILRTIDGKSSIHATCSTLEECKYSSYLLRMIASLKLFSQMKYREAYHCVDLSNLTEYLNYVLIPMLGVIRTYFFLDYEGELFVMENFDIWKCTKSIPNPEWSQPSEEEYKEYLKEVRKRQKRESEIERKREKERQAEMVRRAEEDVMLRNKNLSAPNIVNTKFAERIDKERASAAAAPSVPVSTTPVVYKQPHQISKILRRREENESKSGETLLIFHHGTNENMTYTKNILKGKNKRFSPQKLVTELPNLLRNPRNKRSLMQSSNIFFGGSVADMGFRKEQLYITIISLCEELASTSPDNNDLRMTIIQNYYGPKKEEESFEQYMYNFRYDVFNSIIMYYVFYANL